MAVSDEFEPIPGRQRGRFFALCWGLLTEVGFLSAGAVFGAMLYLPGRIDGWLVWHMMLFGSIAGLIGIPFALLAAVAIWWLD